MALPSAHGRAWYAALGADKMRRAADPNLYEDLAIQSKSVQSNEIEVLEKDVGRTFPERAEFQTKAARERLRRVLGAYAVRNTYCQGMSFVAALMLQHLPERDTFWAIAALIERFLPSGYFTDELQGAYMDQHIAFAVFLPHLMPKLARHFTANEFPLALVGVRWFLCLFAADMEPEHTCKLWDVLFAHGAHMLFALALGLLTQHQQRLLDAPDLPELFSAVREIGKATPSWSDLRELARGFPSEADVQVARAAYLRAKEPPPQSSEESENANNDNDEGGPSSADGAAARADGITPAAGGDAAAVGSTAPDFVPPASPQVVAVAPVTTSNTVVVASVSSPVAIAAPAKPRGKTPSEVIAEALAEVQSCRDTAGQLLAGRRGLETAVSTRRELAELLGGEETLRALRHEYDPPIPKSKPPEQQSFWSAAVASLGSLLFDNALQQQDAGAEHHHPRGEQRSRNILGPWSKRRSDA